VHGEKKTMGYILQAGPNKPFHITHTEQKKFNELLIDFITIVNLLTVPGPLSYFSLRVLRGSLFVFNIDKKNDT
jgi:hypothetical protein